MPTYRKKPVLLQAFHLGSDALPDWFMDAVKKGTIRVYPEDSGYPFSSTMTHLVMDADNRRGAVRARRGDWVIRGVNGDIYPCSNDEFIATHEKWFGDKA